MMRDSPVTNIFAGRLFDPRLLEFREKIVITVSEESGLIISLEPCSDEDFENLIEGKVVDLRELTVLPGFVDVDVHCILHS
jgi:dihydroorotase-like cyclic amidohydrolase